MLSCTSALGSSVVVFVILTSFVLVKYSHAFITRYFLLGLATHYCESCYIINDILFFISVFAAASISPGLAIVCAIKQNFAYPLNSCNDAIAS